MYRRLGKRFIDLALGIPLLLMALPLMVVVGLVLALTQGRPVLFRQTRPGVDAVPFTILKFRTMLEGDASDEDRLTRVGSVVRRFSLDEMPSLFNVLRGDMSLVGPRPLLVHYLPLYDAEQARRHEVKPGLTGWTQVNGRNALSWDDKFRLDVWYVDNVSLSLDLRILLRTAELVLRGTGVQQPGHATTKYFSGNAE